ncbi:MAG: response regulator [Planctomycetota bacterium]|jgi:signal transduction histidine kinase/CheY-like chemotaxis protein|nr:response regulator [Planctomycetota bacterium]
MRIKSKLIIGFLLTAIFTAVTNSFGIVGLSKLGADTETLQVQLENTGSIGRLGVTLQRIRIAFRTAIIVMPDRDRLNAQIAEIEKNEAILKENLHILWEAIDGTGDATQAERMRNALEHFYAELDDEKQALQGGNRMTAVTFLYAELYADASNPMTVLQKELDILSGDIDARSARLKNEDKYRAAWFVTALVLLSVAAITIAVVIGLYLAVDISAPIVTMTSLLKHVGETGDLKFAREEWVRTRELMAYGDEVSEALAAFVKMLDQFAYYGQSLESVANGNLDIGVTALGKSDTMGVSLATMVGRLRQSVAEIKMARQTAEEANRIKSEFISNVSHEIRTPLNAILGLTELELQKDLPSETSGNLNKIHTSGMILLRLINDILDMSKIEADKFELVEDDYDFPDMLGEEINVNVARIGSKSISFDIAVDENTPRRFRGDETRVKQILNNLLSNAFKFTEKGTVWLRVACERRNGEAWIVFVVSDTGCGIREEDMVKLFQKYTQVETGTNRQVGGTGLGLSICKSLAEMMGGTISAESEYGKGSSFTVKILQRIVDATPIGADAARRLRYFQLATPYRKQTDTAFSPMPEGKVLVVDDVQTNLDVAKGLIERYGLTVHAVTSGKKAIEIIRDGVDRYDIIFMDHMMPEMDGLEAIRIIRKEIGTEYAKTIPIVMLTANVVSGRREMFIMEGADDVLAKPIDILLLDSLLRTWLPKGKREVEMEKRKAGKDEPHPAIPGVDIRMGIGNASGSVSLYRKLLQTFCSDVEDRIGEIERAVETEDTRSYTTLVHGLKGAARVIAATEFSVLAERMQRAGEDGDMETIREGTGALLSSLAELTENIRNAVK